MTGRIPAQAILREADRLIRRTGTRDPAEICRQLGIEVSEADLRRRIKAYYFCQSRIENIVLDQSVTPLFRRILLAHELGHARLHRRTALLRGFQELEVLEKRDTDPMETEANLFAAELLLPDEEVLPLLAEYSFFGTASLLAVPAALLDFKFTLLQEKGYALQPLGVARPDFLKEDLEAFTDRPVRQLP